MPAPSPIRSTGPRAVVLAAPPTGEGSAPASPPFLAESRYDPGGTSMEKPPPMPVGTLSGSSAPAATTSAPTDGLPSEPRTQPSRPPAGARPPPPPPARGGLPPPPPRPQPGAGA